MSDHWKSPLLEVPTLDLSHLKHSTNNGANEEDSSFGVGGGTGEDDPTFVQVPHSGLYGLCFGVANAKTLTTTGSSCEHSEEKDKGDSNPSVPEIPKCTCREDYVADLTAPCSKDQDDHVDHPFSGHGTTQIRLPMSAFIDVPPQLFDNNHDMESKQGADALTETNLKRKVPPKPQVLMSTDVGRVIYLPARTMVRVTRRFKASSCCPCCPQTKQNTDLSGAPEGTKIEWCLILHKIISQDGTGKEEEGINNIESSDGDREVKRVRLHEKPNLSSTVVSSSEKVMDGVDLCPKMTQKKPFACGLCARRFPSTRSVHQHLLSGHMTTDNVVTQLHTGPALLRKPLKVVYDNSVMAIVMKPQGVSVMGERWTLSRSDLFLPLMAASNVEEALRKPRAVHRLDSPTGGLLVIAKTFPAESTLRACFANRTCHKRYRAIVFGKVELPHGQKEMTIDHAMDGGKSAVTRVEVVQYSHSNDTHATDGWLTTVDLFPITGRTHQLRKHMKYVGHPIWGDRRYGPYRKSDEPTGDAAFAMDDNESEIDVDQLEATTVQENPHCKLCLWALEISFPHPISGESVTVSIDEPEWYQQLRSDQALRWQESKHA